MLCLRLYNIYAIIILLLFTITISCTFKNQEETVVNDFSIKGSQELSARNIIEFNESEKVISLSESYGMLHGSELSADETFLYIKDHHSLLKLVMIGKKNLILTDSLTISQGLGPEEMESLFRYDLSKEYVAVINRPHNIPKVQLWNKGGVLKNEFLIEGTNSSQISFWDDGNMTVLTSGSILDGNIFFTYDEAGNLLNSFGDVTGEQYNPIRFSGQILIDDGYLYFAGYSEHILAKWDREGALSYAMTTIDDVPGDVNHVSVVGQEQSIFTYTDFALFSAIDAAIYNDYWLIVHRGDWNEDPYVQYLDVYNKNNGKYLATFQFPNMITSIAIDDEFLYTLENIEDEIFLVIYENNINGIFHENSIL